MPEPYVIVGTGAAGATAALTLRAEGYDGDLVMIGDEPELPYRRPPLSKEVLTGAQSPARTLLRPAGSWAERGIEVRTATAVTAIDPAGRTVTLADGTPLPYHRLLLATGGRARQLPGTRGLPGVHHLRTLADARRLREALTRGGPVLVVGGGLIGLEVAAAARGAGCEVTVAETEPYPLRRVLPPRIADAVTALHRSRGVDVRTGVRLDGFEASGHTVIARDAAGARLEARTVVVAVGMAPRTALAERAGLTVDDGIVVDAYGATSAPGIWAAGDVTRRPVSGDIGTRRIEHWTNAQEHGAAVARTMLGAATPYTPVPWFWTQQYGTTLQSCGDIRDDDTMAVSGDIDALDFAAVVRRAGRTAAVACGNRPAEFRGLRAAIGAPVTGADGSPGEFGTARNGPSAFEEATGRSTL